MSKAQKQLKRTRNMRSIILAVTVFCISVSVTLNVLHAPASLWARVVAGLPPVAAFFVIELVARIPTSSKALSFGRVLGSLVVGGVAGSISYVQQIDYVRSLGYHGWIAMAFPAVIDGTMLVTTLSLVEVVRTLRTLEDAEDEAQTPMAGEVVGVASELEAIAAGADAAESPDIPVSPAPAGPRGPYKKAPDYSDRHKTRLNAQAKAGR